MFTGKDISVSLAKMSFDPQNFNKYGEIPLTDKEQKVLNEWYVKYDSKYKKVGYIRDKSS